LDADYGSNNKILEQKNFVIQTIRMFARPFYFLRHGETVANANGIISGSSDVPLTPLGYKQAHVAARALAHEPITGIYSSPLQRARETAEPIARTLCLSVNVLRELSERERGDLEGKPSGMRVGDESVERSERFDAFVLRVLRGLSQINTDTPLVVAHLGVFRALCQTLDVTTAQAVPNALPMRLMPLSKERWRLEAITPALAESLHDQM
jgi:broad specificity phosphatase PhoE